MHRIIIILVIYFLPFTGTAQLAFPDLTLPIFAGNDIHRVIENFSVAVKDKEKVSLNWVVPPGSPAEFLTIERSDNGQNFEIVGVLKLMPEKSSFTWIDEAPKKGKNFYRIKYELGGNESFHSKTVAVLFGTESTYKFYPNPVDNILIIRTEIPLEIQIIDHSGKTRIPKTKVAGLQTVNVSDLEKGIYLLRVTNLISNTITQEKLVKN